MLKLRPDVSIVQLRPEHAERMYNWVSDPLIATALGLRHTPSLHYTLTWIQRSLTDKSISASAIMLNGVHVGNVVLDKTDTYLKTSRLSVYLGDASVRGVGVGLTGIYHALAAGFKNLALYKIWLTAHVNNQVAVRTYSKLGFKVEGVLRSEFIIGSERANVYYMGLLRDEFDQISARFDFFA